MQARVVAKDSILFFVEGHPLKLFLPSAFHVGSVFFSSEESKKDKFFLFFFCKGSNKREYST